MEKFSSNEKKITFKLLLALFLLKQKKLPWKTQGSILYVLEL